MKTLEYYSIKDAGWIETGTYKGETTRFLAKRFSKVISIEPSPIFYNFSKNRLRRFKNVILLNGTSEDLLESSLVSVLPAANIWLDGHYSDGGTFLGKKVSPVEEELTAIQRNLNYFHELVIFIDDVRLFPHSNDDDTGYPTFQWVINWCTQNKFKWQVQNDILIIVKK